MYSLDIAIEINKRLAVIANLINEMAHAGTANPSNQAFVKLMNELAALIEQQFLSLSDEIYSRMP
ncbi:MAG: hypothetical protein ACK4FN_02830 [Acinetobacter johnsonii]